HVVLRLSFNLPTPSLISPLSLHDALPILLRPGGVFYFRDAHPTLLTIDPDADGLLVRDRYFANGLAQRWESEFTYTGDTRMQSTDRKSTRLNSSHVKISYAVFCLKKKNEY